LLESLISFTRVLIIYNDEIYTYAYTYPRMCVKAKVSFGLQEATFYRLLQAVDINAAH